jgi:hypothetical protein
VAASAPLHSDDDLAVAPELVAMAIGGDGD